MTRKILLVLILLTASSHASAFGAAGHETVCEIAFIELTPKARSAVLEIMSFEKDKRFQSFRDACVWPDYPSAAANSRKPDHYINLPRNWHYIKHERCIDSDSCLFSAIRQDESVLKNPNSSSEEKLESLKFLGHWLGDIHQPLHISYKDDRGGNEIELKNGIGCKKKLHAVWDTCIFEDQMKEDGFDTDSDGRAKYGSFLQSQITNAQREDWASNVSLTEWAEESLQIARKPEVLYCIQDGRNCRYSEKYELYNEHQDDGVKVLILNDEYEDKFGEKVRERVMMAGVRLGKILNEIFN